MGILSVPNSQRAANPAWVMWQFVFGPEGV
jgi:hypothetical protein